MKQLLFTLIAVCMLAVFALPAMAQVTVTQNDGTDVSPLGGEDTDASNPDHDDGPTIRTVSATYTLTDSTGSSSVVTLTMGAAETKYLIESRTFDLNAWETQYNSPQKVFYDIDITNIDGARVTPGSGNTFTITMPATSSTPVTLTVQTMIPATLDAVDAVTLQQAGFGVLTAKFTGAVTPAVDSTIFMQRSNGLLLDSLKAQVNDRRTENLDEDGGDEIQSIKPGDTIEVTVKVDSDIDDREELDIENVEAELTCANSGDFDVDDETLDLGDFSPEDEVEDAYTIIVEDDAEDRTSNCEIEVSGEDEFGALHGIQSDFDIEVNRESHDIIVRMPVSVSPQAITCDTDTLTVTIEFANLGTRDEDDVAIELSSTTLDYVERFPGIELDEDDESDQVFSVPIEHPIKVTPVAFTIKTFYDNVRSSNTETFLVENTCFSEDNGELPEEKNGATSSPSTPTKVSLIIENDAVEATREASVSVGAQVTNEESRPVDFIVEVINVEEFAQPSASKKLTLQPGQTTTVFMNIRVSEDVEDGMYTGSIQLLANGAVVETQQFTVSVSGEKASSGPSFDFSGNGGTLFWIIINVILIVIAIFFIRLIFTSGRKKSKEARKMADYEAKGRARRR